VHDSPELGISEITVKAHRGQIMQKMKADSLAPLVKMAARLRSARPPDEVPSFKSRASIIGSQVISMGVHSIKKESRQRRGRG